MNINKLEDCMNKYDKIQNLYENNIIKENKKAIQSEWNKVDNKLRSFMAHTEMYMDENEAEPKRLHKLWSDMDKAYERLQQAAKMFIKFSE